MGWVARRRIAAGELLLVEKAAVAVAAPRGGGGASPGEAGDGDGLSALLVEIERALSSAEGGDATSDSLECMTRLVAGDDCGAGRAAAATAEEEEEEGGMAELMAVLQQFGDPSSAHESASARFALLVRRHAYPLASRKHGKLPAACGSGLFPLSAALVHSCIPCAASGFDEARR